MLNLIAMGVCIIAALYQLATKHYWLAALMVVCAGVNLFCILN